MTWLISTLTGVVVGLALIALTCGLLYLLIRAFESRTR